MISRIAWWDWLKGGERISGTVQETADQTWYITAVWETIGPEGCVGRAWKTARFVLGTARSACVFWERKPYGKLAFLTGVRIASRGSPREPWELLGNPSKIIVFCVNRVKKKMKRNSPKTIEYYAGMLCTQSPLPITMHSKRVLSQNKKILIFKLSESRPKIFQLFIVFVFYKHA